MCPIHIDRGLYRPLVQSRRGGQGGHEGSVALGIFWLHPVRGANDGQVLQGKELPVAPRDWPVLRLCLRPCATTPSRVGPCPVPTSRPQVSRSTGLGRLGSKPGLGLSTQAPHSYCPPRLCPLKWLSFWSDTDRHLLTYDLHWCQGPHHWWHPNILLCRPSSLDLPSAHPPLPASPPSSEALNIS